MARTSFATESRRPMEGSHRAAFSESTGSQPLPARTKITVTVMVRRKSPLTLDAMGEHRLTRAAYRKQHGAEPAALKSLLAFAKEFELSAEADADRCTVQLTGTASAMQKAFGVTLTRHTCTDGKTYRIREGEIHLPESLAEQVEAVLGLDNRPQAKPHFRIARSAGRGKKASGAIAHPRAVSQSYTPVEVVRLYGLPEGSRADGQTIALIELGGGFQAADITAYFKGLGQTPPKVIAVEVDGGKNKSDGPNGADGEVMLDIEVAGAVAPGAAITVYFAPNSDQGFVDAVTTAIHDTTNKPSVISISWGGPESTWTGQARKALDAACQTAAAFGITVLAAAGDNGSDDGVGDGENHVDFPASSPHVLACGGTKLTGSGTEIAAEVVWNESAENEGATGGGISTAFSLPSWQSGVTGSGKLQGRGVPDVSGNADPSTGYQVRVDGEKTVIGGTSAVAPLWAGLIAVCNARSKTTAGFVQPKLYAGSAAYAFRDITEGNNGAFQAGKGWDACTGLGSPRVSALLDLLGPVAKGKARNGTAARRSKLQPSKANSGGKQRSAA